MTQPLPYERDFSFTGFQSGHPKTPLPGDKVDLELDQVAATLDEVLARIAIIQRDDLALANKSVGYDQLKDEVSLGFEPPDVWTTATTYAARDTVFNGTGFYRCLAAHTSNVFATDLAAGQWELLVDFADSFVASGIMLASVYDPQGKKADAFARANQTGTQAAATISDFSAAADLRVAAAVGVSVQAYDVDLDAIATLTTTVYGRSLLTSASVAALSATWVNIQTGAGAVSRSVKSKLAERISVKDFGAVGDGVTDDAAAIQAALDAVKAAGGGTLYVPGTSTGYKITSGLTYDISALTGRFNSRLQIVGDGPSVSFINLASVAGTALTITGATSASEMHCHFEGFRLTGNSTVGSKGLVLTKSAFGSCRNLVIEAFDYNMDCTDVEQVAFYDSNFRWGIHGARFNAAAIASSPNSLVFVNCAFANNTTWGWQITNANAVTFIGGSTQYNGATAGGSTMWGGKVIEAGNGYGNVLFLGHIFEGNGGDSDFISEQTTNVGTYTFEGVGFARPNSTSYATNFVKLDGASASAYSFKECTFRGYNSYTPNAARPYFAVNNNSALIFDSGSNIYGSATEWPGWAGYMRVPTNALIGAGAIPLGASKLVTHIGTDKNFYVNTGFTLTSGIAIGSINDANASLQPMEFRTSQLLVTGGSIGRTVPVTKTGNFTVGLAENWLIVNQAATTTVTLPSASLFPAREIMIKTIQAQLVISASSNVVPLAGGAASTAILAATSGKWVTLVSNGTNWEIMAGN